MRLSGQQTILWSDIQAFSDEWLVDGPRKTRAEGHLIRADLKRGRVSV